MKEGELAVLFRNNHYLTITKQKEKLFNLVTDQGYLDNGTIVWEEITYSGGGEFFNEDFLTKTEVEASDAILAQKLDENLAKQLQREEQSKNIP